MFIIEKKNHLKIMPVLIPLLQELTALYCKLKPKGFLFPFYSTACKMIGERLCNQMKICYSITCYFNINYKFWNI